MTIDELNLCEKIYAVKWATFFEMLEWHHLRHICAIININSERGSGKKEANN